MSMRFTDGFDSYGATADLLKYWQVNSGHITWNATAGRTGGGALVADGTANNSNLYNMNIYGSPPGVGTANTMFFEFWMQCPSAPAANNFFVTPLTTNVGIANGLMLQSTGILGWTNTSVGTVAINGLTNVCDGNWHWVAFGSRSGTTTGQAICYVDNILQWNNASLAMSNSSLNIAGFAVWSVISKANIFDDFVTYENDGGNSPNGAQFSLGPRIITTERPNSDVTNTFTSSTGSPRYAQLNETVGDMSQYVSDANTSGHQELYGQTALGIIPAVITGVSTKTYGVNPGTGNVSLEHTVKSNVTTQQGSSFTMPLTNALTNMTFFPTDPNTSAAWTAAGINAASFGFTVP